jgi:SAM-dependent methyltransferase
MAAPPSAGGLGDALFTQVERFHAPRPWGRVLDAGTGLHSLSWICGLPTASWTAVTGAEAREHDLRARFADRLRPPDAVVTGNWQDELLLVGQTFDVIVADYLIGAIDGFAPYFQGQALGRLRRHLAPGGRLYVIGLEPYPDEPADEAGALILEIARLRDALILLAKHRCYREYPRAWVHRSLEASGYVVEESVAVPIVYGERFIDGQLNVCRSKLPLLADRALAAAFDATIEELRARAHAAARRLGGLRFGEDYVVVARGA